jgi:hypothetical protein
MVFYTVNSLNMYPHPWLPPNNPLKCVQFYGTTTPIFYSLVERKHEDAIALLIWVLA